MNNEMSLVGIRKRQAFCRNRRRWGSPHERSDYCEILVLGSSSPMYRYKSFRDFIGPGFVPAVEVLLFRQKKPSSGRAHRDALCTGTPRPAASEGTDANYGIAGQLAGLQQGPQGNKSVHPWGRAGGVERGRGEE